MGNKRRISFCIPLLLTDTSLHIHRPSQSDEVRAFQSLLIEYLEIRLLQAAAPPRLLLTTAQATRYVNI